MMMLKTAKKANRRLYNIDVENLLSLPTNVYWVNTEGKILGYNECVAQLFNSNLTDGLGLSYDVIGKDQGWLEQAYSFQADDIEVMSSGCSKAGVIEPPVPFSDNAVRYYVTTRSPLRDQDGRVVGAFGISMDITHVPHLKQHNIDLKLNVSEFSQDKLSSRQSECLHYLVRGMTAKQIAQTLNLSHRTVEFYLDNLKVKLQCKTKAELVNKAFEMGFGRS
jgi:DNA-binding CsgD family transcriptional regulator